MTTLVSFIGNPQRSQSPAPVAPRMPAALAEYEATPYRFEDGFESRTLFFGWAALLHLRHRAQVEKRPELSPARWVVVGTPSSAWHMMAEVAIEADGDLLERAAEWSARTKSAWTAARDAETTAAQATAVHALLREFEAFAMPALATDLRMRAVDDSADAIFALLRDEIDAGGRVILDVTHGFRTMPIHATLALGALRWLKAIEVDDILYGGIEKRGRKEYAPAVSLATSARLAQATPALAQLALVDDVGHVAEVLEPTDRELAARLRETQRYESLMQFSSSSGPRGQAIGRLRKLREHAPAAGEITHTIAETVRGTLASLNAGSDSQGLRNRAQRALERNDYMRAIGLANEMLLLRAVELRALKGNYKQLNDAARDEVYRLSDLADAPCTERANAHSNFTTLNYLRNAVMHPDGGITDMNAPRETRNADDMRALLRWSLTFYDFLH